MKGMIQKHRSKDGRVSWGYVYDAGVHPDGSRRQIRRKGFRFERDAQAALRDAIGDTEKNRTVHKDSRTFENFFREWLEQHGATHWGPVTREANGRRAAYAIRMFGSVKLQELTATRIEQDLLTLMKRGGRKTTANPKGTLSAKTIREVAALVTQCLKKAVKRKLIESNPMNDVDRPSVQRKEVQILEPEDYEKLLDRVRGTRYYGFCVVAANTGCRRGELLALRWDDIDLHTGLVTVSKSLSDPESGLEIKTTKTGQTRHVGISETTIQILREHRARIDEEKRLFGPDYAPHNLVFARPDGDFYNPSQITNRIGEFMREAGVNASLHKLRHFSASMMLSQKVPITVVSKRLGHANSTVTLNVYSHAMRSDESAAAALWDKATSDIIARTRQVRAKTAKGNLVTFCDPAKGSIAVNE
jgi:integrase